MTDQTPAPVSAEPKEVETAGVESFIDKRRMEVERQAAPDPVASEAVEDTPKTEEAPKKGELPKIEEEADPVARFKKNVQKRIDKEVAKRKTAEEELADARSELVKLRSSVPQKEVSKPEDNTPPTPEQVEAYIAKMQEDGQWKEAAQATRYLIKLEKETAIKEVRDEQEKASTQAKAKSDKQLSDWINLQRDYVILDASGKPDLKSDLTLSNESGLLYQRALSFYKDKDLHAERYNDPDTIMGFRRAVSDAYREIHQQGLITPKGESITAMRRSPLAEPDAETSEDVTQSNNSLSDADKVREEIKARRNNRFVRKPA
jgi:hypothetical protein